MKRHLLFVLLTTIIGIGTFTTSAQIKKDWDTFNLVGYVQSVRVDKSKFNLVAGEFVEEKPRPWEQTNFDKYGYYTDRIGLENGNTRAFRNRHDSLGQIIERTDVGSGERTIFRYSPGKVETTTELKDGHVLDRNIYTLDAKGNELMAEYFLVDENLGRRFYDPPAKSVRRYDEKGNLLERASFNRDGSPKSGVFGEVRYVYKYDKDNRLVEWSAFKADGSLFCTWFRKYDEKGRIIQVTSTNFPKVVFSEFDSQGNWLKSVTYKKVEKDGDSTYVPAEADYRTIKYY